MNNRPPYSIEIVKDGQAFARRAAQIFVSTARDATRQRGRFHVALSGGSTPQAVYHLLASPEFRTKVDWGRVHVWWGDERCVSPEDPASNYRMAREALLSKVPIPKENVHRMRGEQEPQAAAEAYSQALAAEFGDQVRLDLVLLGLGSDGHTASLFPGSAALRENEILVAANWVEALKSWRLTLTYTAINAARKALFLVQGAAKAGILKAVLADTTGEYPASGVQLPHGELIWLVDERAGEELGLN